MLPSYIRTIMMITCLTMAVVLISGVNEHIHKVIDFGAIEVTPFN